MNIRNEWLLEKMAYAAVALLLIMSVTGCSNDSGNGPIDQPPVLERPEPGLVGDGRLGEILNFVVADTGVPAVGAKLVHNGSVVEFGTAGMRTYGGLDAVTDLDQWHIGSLTKSMTATLSAVLVEQGLLGWNSTVGEVFPDLVGTVHPAYLDVRLDELLSHTGGIPTSSSAIADSVSQIGGNLLAQRLRFTREVLSVAPHQSRGSYAYSNAGYIVAGAMLERLTGSEWEHLMQTYVFNPLGMNDTGFGAPGANGSPNQPTGHIPDGAGWHSIPSASPNADNPALFGPAGTVHSTMADIAKYMTLHLAGAHGEFVPGYLTAASFAKLHQPMPDAQYALGWNVSEFSLHHIGSNNRWLAQIIVVPGIDVALFIVTNAADADATDGGSPSYALGETAQYLNDRIDAAMAAD